MTYDRQKVIDIALAEVGYLEKESNSQLDDKTANAGDNNRTKYARDLDAINFYNGRKQGAAWCDVFVDWGFWKAYGKDAALALTCQPTKAASNCGAGCKYSRNYYKSKGQLCDSPEPGDQVFFWSKDKSSISHTGLVYKVSGGKVYTVEGNTSGASGVVANGGGVFKKSYSLTYSRIAGYGRPKYGSETPVESPAQSGGQELAQQTGTPANSQIGRKKVTVELNTLRKGDQGEQVKTLQRLLNAMGYDSGKVDGIFGENTRLATRAFQQTERLDVDGVVGKDTWTALLK